MYDFEKNKRRKRCFRVRHIFVHGKYVKDTWMDEWLEITSDAPHGRACAFWKWAKFCRKEQTKRVLFELCVQRQMMKEMALFVVLNRAKF